MWRRESWNLIIHTLTQMLHRQPRNPSAAKTVTAVKKENLVTVTRAQRPEAVSWTRGCHELQGQMRRCGQQQHWASSWFSSRCRCFTHACIATGGPCPVFTGTTHSWTTTVLQVRGSDVLVFGLWEDARVPGENPTQGEHTSATRKGLGLVSNPWPSCCEAVPLYLQTMPQI